MIFLNNGGAFALGGGVSATGAAPAPALPPAGGTASYGSSGTSGILKTIANKIDFGGLLNSLFGLSAHEKEHIARVQGLYDRAIAGDASAYSALVEITTAKWPGQPDKWLRPEHERKLAEQALTSLRTSTEFVTAVATNPAYAEVRKLAQDLRDDLAAAVGRLGAGATQAAVDAIGGEHGANTGGAVLPLTRTQLTAIAVVAAALILIAIKKRKA